MRSLSLIGLALAACGGQPPAPAPAPEPPAPPVVEAPEPEAGIPVVAVPSTSPIAEIRVVFRAGSAFDPPGREGLGRLLALTMAEGGTQALTYPELLDTLHPWAAVIGTQVDRELVTFVARVHRDHLDAFYPIFRDVLLKPRLGQEDFERLRQKALTQLTQEVRTSNDEELSKLVLERVLFTGHPYGHPPIGTERALKTVTLDDLKAHRARVLTQARVTVGVAGAADDALAARLRTDLQALPAGEPAPEVPPAPPAAYRLVVVEQPTAKSAAIAIGHPLPVLRGDAGYAALKLVASWFGEHRQFHGRLFQSIREARGMNYGDYAYEEAFIQEGWTRFPRTNIARSRQHFSMWIRPVPSEDRLFALRIALWNLRRLTAEGLSEDDVAKTREFLDGYLYLQQQTDQRRLGYAIDDRFYSLRSPYAEWLRAEWAGLDAATTNDALRQHVRPDQVTMVVVTADAQGFVDAVLDEAESPKAYASPKPDAILAEDREIARLPLDLQPSQVTIIPAERLFAK